MSRFQSTVSRPAASRPQIENQEPVREHRVFGWDKHENAVPAKSCVRFTCRPTNEVGSPQFRTSLIRVADMANPDPARYDTLDRLCGYYARQMELAFKNGTLDPTSDEAWEPFVTEAAPLPAFLSRPKVAATTETAKKGK